MTESWFESFASPFASLSNAISEIKKRNQLRSPGAWENLHREIKGLLLLLLRGLYIAAERQTAMPGTSQPSYTFFK
jgi:hypothetical protein